MSAWRLDEDHAIVELRRRGMSAKLISRQVGRTPHAIGGRLHLLGARLTRTWSPDEDAIIRARYRSAPVTAWLSELPNRTEGSVHARAHRLGIARPRRVWPDD